jgi:hypothetical protein
VPAAAVTPAPIAYIKVAAVKKLVVGSGLRCDCQLLWAVLRHGLQAGTFARRFVAVSLCLNGRLDGVGCLGRLLNGG